MGEYCSPISIDMFNIINTKLDNKYLCNISNWYIPIAKVLHKLIKYTIIFIKDYILCCCGTIDGWYDDQDKDIKEIELVAATKDGAQDETEKTQALETAQKQTKESLVVRPSMINEVFSGSEMMSDSEMVIEEGNQNEVNNNDNNSTNADNRNDNNIEIELNQAENDDEVGLSEDEEPW